MSLNNLYINNLYFNNDVSMIQTFRLIPNYEKIDEFVISEMNKIPEDERILKKDDPVTFWSFRNNDDVVYDCGAFSLRKEDEEKKSLALTKFMQILKTGEPSYFKPEEIRDRYDSDEKLFSFSIGYDPYSIQTTENLYKLGLLETRAFDSELLQSGDLTEIANLFSLSDEIKSTDLEEVDRLITYGVIKDTPDRISNYENSTKVYKNLRKYYK